MTVISQCVQGNLTGAGRRRLQIHPQPRRYSFAGVKMQICHALDGRVSLFYGDTPLEHSHLAGGWHFYVATVGGRLPANACAWRVIDVPDLLETVKQHRNSDEASRNRGFNPRECSVLLAPLLAKTRAPHLPC